MAALAQLLFPVPDVRRSPATLLSWWESRRPTYNLIVGGSGLITLTVLHTLSWLPPHVSFDAPWPLIVLYGVCANLCYSFGFAIEALFERLWGEDVAPVGPTLFRHGLVFSVGLTLFPIGIAWLSWLFLAARHLLF
ncbi:MAG: hypothetical protein M3Z10_03290 [Gemmatimonadota bacterium]|nr:hypothetical protein [Gemmatimonadota bacterium]